MSKTRSLSIWACSGRRDPFGKASLSVECQLGSTAASAESRGGQRLQDRLHVIRAAADRHDAAGALGAPVPAREFRQGQIELGGRLGSIEQEHSAHDDLVVLAPQLHAIGAPAFGDAPGTDRIPFEQDVQEEGSQDVAVQALPALRHVARQVGGRGRVGSHAFAGARRCEEDVAGVV